MTVEGNGPRRQFAFVVGAPRCGTTSLSNFLRDHPDVNFSRVKEPHFFTQFDLTGLSDEALRERVANEYLRRYFDGADDGAGLLAEGSVSYLYSASQMAPILRLWPEARFVIAIRDPLEMLPSLHRRLLYLGDETVGDFATAWSLSPQRAAGRSVPRSCIDHRWLQYDEIGRLGRYVEEFIRTVGRERCMIVRFDDLALDPGREYRRMLAFLGLPDDGRTDFAPRRSTRGYKSQWLQRLLKRPPHRVRAVLAGEQYRQRIKPLDTVRAEPWLTRVILAGRKRLLRWNRAPAPPVLLSEALKAEIRDTYREDVALLARVTGYDLRDWLGGASARQPDVVAPDVRTAARG